MKLYQIKEVQIGFFVLILSFLLSFFSGINANLANMHLLIIIVISILLIIFLLELNVIIAIPDKFKTKHRRYFHEINNMTFLFIYFSIISLGIAFIAEALGEDRSYNILLVSMLITNFYNLLVMTQITYSFLDVIE